MSGTPGYVAGGLFRDPAYVIAADAPPALRGTGVYATTPGIAPSTHDAAIVHSAGGSRALASVAQDDAVASLAALALLLARGTGGLDAADMRQLGKDVLAAHAFRAYDDAKLTSDVWNAVHSWLSPHMPRQYLEAGFQYASPEEARAAGTRALVVPAESMARLLRLTRLAEHTLHLGTRKITLRGKDALDLRYEDVKLYAKFASLLRDDFGIDPQHAFPYWVASNTIAYRNCEETLRLLNPDLAGEGPEPDAAARMAEWFRFCDRILYSVDGHTLTPEARKAHDLEGGLEGWRDEHVREMRLLFSHAIVDLPKEKVVVVPVIRLPSEELARLQRRDAYGRRTGAGIVVADPVDYGAELPVAENPPPVAAAPETPGAPAAEEQEEEEEGEAAAAAPTELPSAPPPAAQAEASAVPEQAASAGTLDVVADHVGDLLRLPRYARYEVIMREKRVVAFAKTVKLRGQGEAQVVARLALVGMLVRVREERLPVLRSLFAHAVDFARRLEAAAYSALLVGPHAADDVLSFLGFYDALDPRHAPIGVAHVDLFNDEADRLLAVEHRAVLASERAKRYVLAYVGVVHPAHRPIESFVRRWLGEHPHPPREAVVGLVRLVPAEP